MTVRKYFDTHTTQYMVAVMTVYILFWMILGILVGVIKNPLK